MSDHGNTDYVKGHTWGITAQMNMTDNLVLFGGYADYNDQYYTTVKGIAAGATDKSTKTWTAGVRWNVASGLYIQTEYTKQLPDLANSYGVYSLRVVRSF